MQALKFNLDTTPDCVSEIKTENVADFSKCCDGNVMDSRCTCDTTERDDVKCELKQETDTDGDDKPPLSHSLDAQLYENGEYSLTCRNHHRQQTIAVIVCSQIVFVFVFLFY